MTRILVLLIAALLIGPPVQTQQNPAPPTWQSEIYVMNIDGTRLRNRANHSAEDQEPEFAPKRTRQVRPNWSANMRLLLVQQLDAKTQ